MLTTTLGPPPTPLRAKYISTKRNAKCAVALVYIILGIYTGYWCSWADQLVDGRCIPNTRPAGLEQRAKVFLVLGLSFYAFLPSIILGVMNPMIIYKMMKMNRKIHPQNPLVSTVSTRFTGEHSTNVSHVDGKGTDQVGNSNPKQGAANKNKPSTKLTRVQVNHTVGLSKGSGDQNTEVKMNSGSNANGLGESSKSSNQTARNVSQKNKSQNYSQKQRNLRSTTFMLLAVTIAFIILVNPVSMSHIISFIRDVNIFETKVRGMVFLREITQVMEQMNNSINFLLYVMCSSRFRAKVLAIFCQRNSYLRRMMPGTISRKFSAQATQTN